MLKEVTQTGSMEMEEMHNQNTGISHDSWQQRGGQWLVGGGGLRIEPNDIQRQSERPVKNGYKKVYLHISKQFAEHNSWLTY